MKRYWLLSLLVLYIPGTVISQHWNLLRDVGNTTEGEQPDVHLEGEQMATDQDGNFYIAGSFVGGDFPGLPGEPDFPDLRIANNYFVAKYGPEGDVLWVSPFYSGLDYISGGLGLVAVHKIRSLYVDDQQNVYVTGSFINQVHSKGCVSNAPDTELTHAFFAKYNADGDCEYIQTGITSNNGHCADIVKAGNGKVYVSCTFKGSIRFSDTTIVATSGLLTAVTESIIAEIDDQGRIVNYSILSSGSGNGRSEINQILVNEDNTLVCAGRCNGKIIFNGQSKGQNNPHAEAFAILLTEDLQPLRQEDWQYAIVTNGTVYDIFDLHTTKDGGYAMSGFFIADKLKFSGQELVTKDNATVRMFHNFLATFNFDGHPGILVTTASLTRNGSHRIRVQTCADDEYIYVLTGIMDSGTIANLVVYDSPDVVTQYLAIIDPSTGACVYIEELHEGSSVGIEIINDQIAISGSFRVLYKLEDKIVTSADYYDIYFALRDKTVVSHTEDTPSETSIPLYPNPVHDWLFLGDSYKDDAFMYNLQGVIIRHIPAHTRKIDVSPLPHGLYFIMTSSGNVKGRFLKS